MKKKLSLLLVTAFAASMLAACGGGTSSSTPSDSSSSTAAADSSSTVSTDEQVNITLATYPIGKWGDSATVDALIGQFNEKYPDINVTVQYLDYTNGDDQVNTAIEGGQAPDVVLEGPERLVANWGARGLMVDLADLWDAEAVADVIAAAQDPCKGADGVYYEYPVCMTAHCMAINKTLFEAAGAMQYIDEENHTWTTEDFFKAVQAVYDYGHQEVGILYCNGQAGDQGTRAIINNLYGGTFTNAEHTAYTVNSPENIQALEELIAQDGIKIDPASNATDEINLFRQGTLAMAFCWNIAQQLNTDNGPAGTTNNGDEILFMAFPSQDGNAELCGGVWGFGIFDNGDPARIEASKSFIDFMANENVVESVKASAYFSVKSSQSDLWADDAIMNEYNKLMPMLGDYYQIVPGWAEARTAWWNMLQSIDTGTDVATAIETFATEANAAAGA